VTRHDPSIHKHRKRADGGLDAVTAEGREMTDISQARTELGGRWGFERPLHLSELARTLKLTGDNAEKMLLDMERGKRDITGPIEVAIEGWLAGAPAPEWVPA
jgi:hypothetical protein